MDLFDTHCHLDATEFDLDREQVLIDTVAAGVGNLLLPGVESATWSALIDLCASRPGLHLALGLHPLYLERHQPQDVARLGGILTAAPAVAIGEIGLDWQLAHLDRQRQQRLLEAQLEVAEQSGLPVVLHVRKAHDQMLLTLRRYRLHGGFCHAFNGSLQQASRYIDLGFCLGFGGMLTYRGSNHLRRLAGSLPLAALVLETDAPDMTVASHRYQRNSPAYLPEVLHSLAEIRQLDPAALARITSDNARRVLRTAQPLDSSTRGE